MKGEELKKNKVKITVVTVLLPSLGWEDRTRAQQCSGIAGDLDSQVGKVQFGWPWLLSLPGTEFW